MASLAGGKKKKAGGYHGGPDQVSLRRLQREAQIKTIHDMRAGTKRIYYGWDHYIAGARVYKRSYPCREATFMP